MYRVLLFTFLFLLFSGEFIYSQQPPPGVTLRTSRMGEDIGAPRPHPDSPIYKIRYVAPENIFFALWAKEYMKGEYKPSSVNNKMASGRQVKGNKLTGEIIPDDLTPRPTMIIFFKFPGMDAFFYMTPTEGLCRKFVTFDTVDTPEDRREFIPYLLIYEDDPADGKEEQIVSNYLKDGKLPYDKATVDKLISGLSRCALVYADIEFLFE